MGKFYWLKLKKDFFKRHDIRIIEDMQDGGQMVMFYLKLLCESVDHDGALRFSDEVPYDNDMLASVTHTDKTIVENAMKLLKRLGMVKVEEDGTILMCGAESMLGSETAWAEKKRQQRDKQGQEKDKKGTMSPQCPKSVPTMSDKRKSIEIEKEKEIELDKEKRVKKKADDVSSATLSESPSKTRFVPPTVEEVKAYCEERKNGIDGQVFCDFYASKNWMVGKSKMKDWKAAVRTWESRRKEEPRSSRKPDEIPTMNDIMTEERTGTWDGVSKLANWERQRLSDSERERYDDWCWEHELSPFN